MKDKKIQKMLIIAAVVVVLMAILGAISGNQGAMRYIMGFLIFPVIAFGGSFLYSRSEDFGVILPIIFAVVSTIILLVMRLGFWVILTIILTLIAGVAGSYTAAKLKK